jgi:hypothetical protein
MVRRILIVIAVVAAGVLTFRLLSDRQGWIELRDSEPRIATIDYYGLHDVPVSAIEAKLRLRVGDAAPVPLGHPDVVMRLARVLSGVASKDSIESRLRQIPGVRNASIAVIQGEDPHRVALFVGISETDAPQSWKTFAGSAVLPDAAADLYGQHAGAFHKAMDNPSPDFDEDDSMGYALFTDPAMKALEESAIAWGQSGKNPDSALVVLETSRDVQQRRSAAWLITYSPDRARTAAALMGALRDPDPDVRNTACRELILIADYGRQHPEANIRLDATPFIGMLHSLSWLDRDKAMGVLDVLTSTRDSALLAQLRREALAPLTEMARWNAASYAEGAFRLIGRMEGLSDDEIAHVWRQGRNEHERVLVAAEGSA